MSIYNMTVRRRRVYILAQGDKITSVDARATIIDCFAMRYKCVGRF